MAYLVRRPSGTLQVRECVRTPGGPRSRTLASFSGALDDAVLAEAERKATQPIDRARLVERARALGVGWQSSTAGAARRLVHGLRRGGSIDPVLRRLVRAELEGARRSGEGEAADGEEPPVSSSAEFEEAAEWIGASTEERAASLRGLLRLGDAIARSRGTRSVPVAAPFPVLSSEAAPRPDPGDEPARSAAR